MVKLGIVGIQCITKARRIKTLGTKALDALGENKGLGTIHINQTNSLLIETLIVTFV